MTTHEGVVSIHGSVTMELDALLLVLAFVVVSPRTLVILWWSLSTCHALFFFVRSSITIDHLIGKFAGGRDLTSPRSVLMVAQSLLYSNTYN